MAKLISLVSDVLNFEAGAYYYGEEARDGWMIYQQYPPNKDTVKLSIPKNLVANTKPLPTAAPVGQSMSKQESSELQAFLGKQQSSSAAPASPAQQQSSSNFGEKQEMKESIVGKILAAEYEVLQNPAELGPTIDTKRQAEIERMRARLAPQKPKLRVGQFFLTDLTNGRSPKSGVDHVIVPYLPTHFPEPLRRDIPEVDLFHEWDPDVLEAIHLSHQLNVKNLLTGFPGSGKSTSIQQYAAIVGQPFMKINGKSGIDGSAFIGFLWANSGGTEFAEGLLPVAMRNGYLLCMDEVFKIPPEVQMTFQTVYEEGGTLLLDEKPGLLADKLVHPHPDFRLMATDNCRGTGDNFEKFGATQVQDTSTLDRFGITALVPYMHSAVETDVLARMYPLANKSSIGRLVKTAGLVREAYQKSNVSVTLSMRGLKVMARLLTKGVSEYAAFIMVYLSKLAEDAEIETVQAFISTAGLSKTAFGAGGNPDELEPPPWEQPIPWEAPAPVKEKKQPMGNRAKPPWEQEAAA